MMTRVCFAGIRCIKFSLMTVPGGEVRVMGRRPRILCFEIPRRFTMMARRFFEMVRCIVMMSRSRMLTGHEHFLHRGVTRRSLVSAPVRRSGHRDPPPIERVHLSIAR